MVITGNESHLKVKIQFNLQAWIDSCGGFWHLLYELVINFVTCPLERFYKNKLTLSDKRHCCYYFAFLNLLYRF